LVCRWKMRVFPTAASRGKTVLPKRVVKKKGERNQGYLPRKKAGAQLDVRGKGAERVAVAKKKKNSFFEVAITRRGERGAFREGGDGENSRGLNAPPKGGEKVAMATLPRERRGKEEFFVDFRKRSRGKKKGGGDCGGFYIWIGNASEKE